jgi:hypothetical protein
MDVKGEELSKEVMDRKGWGGKRRGEDRQGRSRRKDRIGQGR